MASDEFVLVRAGRRIAGHGDSRRMIIDDLWRQPKIVRRRLGTT